MFYTDGLADAAMAGEEYGIGPPARRRRDPRRAARARAWVTRILDDFDAFMEGAEHPDDVTVVVVKVL